MQKCIFYMAEHSNIFPKNVIICYGASGHGKGLVDVMSEFGVKGPLKKAVWCEDISYSCADDVTKYLVAKFADDDTKYHVHLNLCKIRKNTIKISSK